MNSLKMPMNYLQMENVPYIAVNVIIKAFVLNVKVIMELQK